MAAGSASGCRSRWRWAATAVRDSVLTGFPPAVPLLVLAGHTVVPSFLARRVVRWE